MNNTDARLWHHWLRINRVMRVMLHTRRHAEAWAVVRVEFKKALALRSEIQAGVVVQLTSPTPCVGGFRLNRTTM
jgi:hypothetical protein